MVGLEGTGFWDRRRCYRRCCFNLESWDLRDDNSQCASRRLQWQWHRRPCWAACRDRDRAPQHPHDASCKEATRRQCNLAAAVSLSVQRDPPSTFSPRPLHRHKSQLLLLRPLSIHSFTSPPATPHTSLLRATVQAALLVLPLPARSLPLCTTAHPSHTYSCNTP